MNGPDRGRTSGRSTEARIEDVRRLLAAAARVYDDRARWTPAIARSTGLSPQGVEVGFACLEREAPDGDLRALVAAAGDTPHVHVVLSANVFVAALRALALARAAAERVTVRPSPRDPTLVEQLVACCEDAAIAIEPERDIARTTATELHVYGRDETIAAVRARARSGVVVRGHGAGLGIAIVTASADIGQAAADVAADVVPFEQRGCASPRAALVEGGEARASAFADALHGELAAWSARVPRGTLHDGERAEATRWLNAMAFAGHVRRGAEHAVAAVPEGAPLAFGPPGRHVLVTPYASAAAAVRQIGSMARYVVAAGTNDDAAARLVAPAHARISPLGRMQRPRLDGPLDRRS
jgi:hypothetical protein